MLGPSLRSMEKLIVHPATLGVAIIARKKEMVTGFALE